MPLDSARWSAALDALAGGFFYGFYNLALLPLSGRKITRDQWLRALLDMACAMATGGLVAFFLTPAITAVLPWKALRDPQAVGFSVGMLTWELTGSVFALAKSRLQRLAVQP